jgi:hypothetical protein
VSEDVPEYIRRLLAGSLEAWHVAGDIRLDGEGALLLTAGGRQLRVARGNSDLPFRWMVRDGERTRGATGIAGLLRMVRAAIDPGHRPVRLRIAPLPLLPP